MIVTISQRPDLVVPAASWLWEAFGRPAGGSFAETVARVERSVPDQTMPCSFVKLADGEPVGVASLVAADLEERPNLSPWLAGVVVAPAARGHGHASDLVRAVEAAAMTAGFAQLWLYTSAAEGLYAKLGWRTVERLARGTKTYAVMRRDLSAQA